MKRIKKLSKKIKDFSLERKTLIKIPAAPISSAVTLANLPVDVETSFIDASGKCFPMDKILPQILTDEKIAESISSVVKSFEYFPETGTISVIDKDLTAFALNKNGVATQVWNSLGVEDAEGLASLSRFADGKMLILKRSGISGVLHKAANGAFVSGSALSTFTTTATSHVSGVTGIPLILASPGLIIFVPLVGGLFFASLERLTPGTYFGTGCGVARDALLVVPRIAEVTLNNVFPGPFLQAMNIDCPFNITGYLRFGAAYEAVPDPVKKGIFTSVITKLYNYLNK